MRVTARFQDYARLGSTLRRVRAADRPLEEGGKKVWHQGDGKTEVISFVDAGGEVMRQECYLEGSVVAWQVDKPLVTGRVQGEKSGGDTIAPDAQLSGSTVLNAVALLDGTDLEDKYLQHFRAVLRLAAQRLPAQGLDPSEVAALRRVTADQPVIRPEELAAHQAKRATPWLPWAIAAAAVATALAGYLAAR